MDETIAAVGGGRVLRLVLLAGGGVCRVRERRRPVE
jgi:hypothetical protein